MLFWQCDLRQDQAIGRIDVDIPGVTNKYVLF